MRAFRQLRPAGFRVGCFVAAAALLCLAPGPAAASPEAAYKKACAARKPVDVVSGPQLDQARRATPERALQMSGVIQGLMRNGDTAYVMLKMVDEFVVQIKATGERPELQTGARVRCLVKPTGRTNYDLVDITWDQTPMELLVRAAQAALKVPPSNTEIALSAEQVRRFQDEQAAKAAGRGGSQPSRGGDATLIVRRAVARFNPRLKASELDAIAGSIVGFCNKYGLVSLDDQLLVVAVIAAESHFNPNARSYKGAAGLGQLMPATAAAHGVNPYDPVRNLEVAIRILRRNLDKYSGRREEQWLLAIAAYNAGNGAVKRHGGVPPYRETRNYVWRIYDYWCQLTGRTAVSRK